LLIGKGISPAEENAKNWEVTELVYYIRGKGNSFVEQSIRELHFSIYIPAKPL